MTANPRAYWIQWTEMPKRPKTAKNIMELAEAHSEFEKLDRELNRLNAKFEKL